MRNTIKILNVSQRFGVIKALDQVDLTFCSGEVRALIGANGSGKSTLVKVLAGYHVPDSGDVEVNGVTRSLGDPRGVSELWKVSIVHQDLGLIEGLSILENFLLPEFSSSGEVKINWRKRNQMVAAYLQRFDVTVSPYRKIEVCSRGTRALIALARAVWSLESGSDTSSKGEEGRLPGTLILDEITAFLSIQEVNLLRNVIRDVVNSGHSVLFVSHDLDEILSLADQITVLRDGRCVADRATAGISKDELFTLIAGRSAAELKGALGPRAEILTQMKQVSVRGLTSGDASMGPIDFELVPGEVLGLTGLVGSGYELVPYALFGADKGAKGELTFEKGTVRMDRLTPPQAIALGIALVPGDRTTQGLWSDMSIAENLSVTDHEHEVNAWLLSWRQLWHRGDEIVKEYSVKAPSSRSKVSVLSGGNAQRVLLAKGITAKPAILLLHEPVQGVDVGSRSHIVETILNRAANGLAVICASSDHEFLSQVANRVLVFSRGQIVQELSPQPGASFVGKDEMVYACQTKFVVDVAEV